MHVLVAVVSLNSLICLVCRHIPVCSYRIVVTAVPRSHDLYCVCGVWRASDSSLQPLLYNMAQLCATSLVLRNVVVRPATSVGSGVTKRHARCVWCDANENGYAGGVVQVVANGYSRAMSNRHVMGVRSGVMPRHAM